MLKLEFFLNLLLIGLQNCVANLLFHISPNEVVLLGLYYIVLLSEIFVFIVK